MKVRFLAEARLELIDTVSYYEGEFEGLGERFWNEVDEHVEWIARNPEVPRLREGGYRRVNLKVFPYHLPYLCRDSTLWVLAIAHNHRQPIYWIKRAHTR